MKNFRIIEHAAFNDASKYARIEDGIFHDLMDKQKVPYDASYRLAMAMELEAGEDSQYPLEDILDQYLVHVEEFLDESETHPAYIFGGTLDSVRELKALLGKRAYNEDFVDAEGVTRVKLIID